MTPLLPTLRRDLSPDRPYAIVHESEPTGKGRPVEVTTVFLTAAECPVGCSMCDLWVNTLEEPTPEGAIVKQLDFALREGPRAEWLKLYNSGNFFDRRSIPPQEYPAIAERCRGFSRIVVENHPRFGPSRVEAFADQLDGQLEVAVGLETVQPRWLNRLNKGISRDDFDRYARWLTRIGIDLRVFLIVGVPGISLAESIRWARLSVRHAMAAGARHVSLIPARLGHGWNGRGHELPVASLADFRELQLAALQDARGRAVITIDLWDVGAETESEVTLLRELRESNLSQKAFANTGADGDDLP